MCSGVFYKVTHKCWQSPSIYDKITKLLYSWKWKYEVQLYSNRKSLFGFFQIQSLSQNVTLKWNKFNRRLLILNMVSNLKNVSNFPITICNHYWQACFLRIVSLSWQPLTFLVCNALKFNVKLHTFVSNNHKPNWDLTNKHKIKEVEPVEPAQMNIYQSNTYRKSLSWLQFDHEPRAQERHISIFVVYLTSPSSSLEHQPDMTTEQPRQF